MKSIKALLRVFFLLAIFLASGNTVFASTLIPVASSVTSEFQSTFNPNRNTKAFVIEEISGNTTHEISSEDKTTPSNFCALNVSDHYFKYAPLLSANISGEAIDHKHRIKLYLFPFHFFW